MVFFNKDFYEESQSKYYRPLCSSLGITLDQFIKNKERFDGQKYAKSFSCSPLFPGHATGCVRGLGLKSKVN